MTHDIQLFGHPTLQVHRSSKLKDILDEIELARQHQSIGSLALLCNQGQLPVSCRESKVIANKSRIDEGTNTKRNRPAKKRCVGVTHQSDLVINGVNL